MIEVLLEDPENKMALVTFEGTSKIRFGFTNEKEKALVEIEQLHAENGTNYYQALKNVENMRLTFSNCAKLSALDVSHFITGNVTSMKAMFAYCAALNSLDVSRFNTEKVTDMSFMFDSCYQITSLRPTFNTSNVEDMQNMFMTCINLAELDLSSFNTAKVTNMDHFFDRCTKVVATLTIRLTSGTYVGIFELAAVYGEEITINYTNSTSSLVDQMIATKPTNANIIKGVLVP